MAYDVLKLEKGMYGREKSFTSVLEELDPSDRYKGTALEGLDAYQRQLKRFDIKVKGPGGDVVFGGSGILGYAVLLLLVLGALPPVWVLRRLRV